MTNKHDFTASSKINGILVVDKSGQMSSRDAVNGIQKQLPRKTKIGHTGTLDPLATGVLVMCVGLATKLADQIQAMSKIYRTRIQFGGTSTTDDADGEITLNPRTDLPTRDEIQNHIKTFVGLIEQKPPTYSALKIDGQRAYRLARQGQDVPLTPRMIRIDRIDMLNFDVEQRTLELEIECGKGTYIRSIARDLGEKFGIGGYVSVLRRIRVGPYHVDQSIPWDADRETILKHLIPVNSEPSA
jgi:tRNA pseudouridine55 synthase